MTDQKRANKGGEIGPNGEWYKGGAFIATTEKAKKSPQKKNKSTGKVEIRPYVWAYPPREDVIPTMRIIAGIHPVEKTGKDLIFSRELNMGYLEYSYSDDPEKRQQAIAFHKACIEAFNRGGVWVNDCLINEVPVFYSKDGARI